MLLELVLKKMSKMSRMSRKEELVTWVLVWLAVMTLVVMIMHELFKHIQYEHISLWILPPTTYVLQYTHKLINHLICFLQQYNFPSVHPLLVSNHITLHSWKSACDVTVRASWAWEWLAHLSVGLMVQSVYFSLRPLAASCMPYHGCWVVRVFPIPVKVIEGLLLTDETGVRGMVQGTRGGRRSDAWFSTTTVFVVCNISLECLQNVIRKTEQWTATIRNTLPEFCRLESCHLYLY